MKKFKKLFTVIAFAASAILFTGCNITINPGGKKSDGQQVQTNPSLPVQPLPATGDPDTQTAPDNDYSNPAPQQNDGSGSYTAPQGVKSICAVSSSEYISYTTIDNVRAQYGDTICGVCVDQMMQNEIYARNGFRFKRDKIRNYFENVLGYTNLTKTDAEAASNFTNIEQSNIATLQKYHKERCTSSNQYIENDSNSTQASSGSVSSGSGLCPFSSSRVITRSEINSLKAQYSGPLCGQTFEQMCINEIYARHGAKFVTPSIQNYFYNSGRGFSYAGISQKEAAKNFTSTEKKNIAILQR